VQKAFVTGASGFIGSALTRRLLGEGIAVRALCRTTAKAQALAEANSNVEIINGDIQDHSAMGGVDRIRLFCHPHHTRTQPHC
jgi:dihydroflavonol-4-reductase